MGSCLCREQAGSWDSGTESCSFQKDVNSTSLLLPAILPLAAKPSRRNDKARHTNKNRGMLGPGKKIKQCPPPPVRATVMVPCCCLNPFPTKPTQNSRPVSPPSSEGEEDGQEKSWPFKSLGTCVLPPQVEWKGGWETEILSL